MGGGSSVSTCSSRDKSSAAEGGSWPSSARVNKVCGLVGKSRTVLRLGSQEYRVLSRVFELGLRVFRPSDLGLDMDRRRLHDVLKRLVARGILARVGRGVYLVCSDLARVLVGKDSDGTRGPQGVGVDVSGPYLDNVRGYTLSGRYVGGDRGRVRLLSELVFFDSVSYAEVLYRVRGLRVDGQLVVYGDGDGVRVEWRPPRGFVKRGGVGSAMRMYWEAVLVGVRSLTELLLREAPPDVRSRFVRWLRGRVRDLVC